MSAMKRIKLGQERECLCGQGSLSRDGIFKLRPEWPERNSHAKISGNNILGRRYHKCKGPGVSLCHVPFLSPSKQVHVMSDILTAAFLEQMA